MKSKRNSFIVLIFGLFLLFPTGGAFADVCKCESDIRDQIPAFNAAVYLSIGERYESLKRHLPFGIPQNPESAINETLIIQRHFLLNYDSDLNTPTWAAYRLTTQDVDNHQPDYVSRKDCFRNYPQDLHPDATPPLCSDYDNDSFDRGHLVNSNDMCRSRIANANTFFLTNMAPQFPNFNQKIWRTLENRVHNLAQSKGEIYIITGAVFDQDGDGKRDPDDQTQRNDGDGRIAVPSHFYKIILYKGDNSLIDALTILLPHNNDSIIGAARRPYLKSHITTIEHIERVTGIRFLPELESQDPQKAEAVMGFKALDLWWSN